MLTIILALALAQATAQANDNPLSPWPTVKPGRVISTPDWSDYRIYPAAARNKGQEGEVLPEVLVGEDGKPLACRILKSSKFAELDSGTCKLMMQMRFEPARDPSGRRIRSRYSRTLVWGLEDERPFASAVLRTHLRLAGGHVASCEVIGGEGPYVAFWSGLACPFFRDVNYYFGSRSQEAIDATIEIALDAGDNAPFLQQPQLSGTVIAEEKIAFTINASGDPSACTPVESRGFGPRGLNNLSPCGRLLSTLWFVGAPKGTPPRRGFFQTRVVEVGG